MSQARDVTATFVRNGKVTLAVDGPGVISGAQRDCHSTCRRNVAGAGVALHAKPRPGYWFTGWSGACAGKRPTCTVHGGRVVAHFRRELELQLRVNSHFVFHSPYEHATTTAIATWRGKPLRGVRVHIEISCPLAGASWHEHVETGAGGRATYSFGTDMPNHIRVVSCVVHGSVEAKGKTVQEDRPAAVGFVHPLWLKTMGTDGAGHIRVRIWGRAGDRIELHSNGAVVARATLPASGWVDVAPAGVHHGSMLFVTGLHGHRSHTIVA
jgi:Divergent InlB B-repeat domain